MPALPPLWEDGSIVGLKARGGFVVDMDWKEGKLVAAEISSVKGGSCLLNYNGEVTELQLKVGEKQVIKF